MLNRVPLTNQRYHRERENALRIRILALRGCAGAMTFKFLNLYIVEMRHRVFTMEGDDYSSYRQTTKNETPNVYIIETSFRLDTSSFYKLVLVEQRDFITERAKSFP